MYQKMTKKACIENVSEREWIATETQQEKARRLQCLREYKRKDWNDMI